MSKVVGEALASVNNELASLFAQRAQIDERIIDLRAMRVVLSNVAAAEDAEAKALKDAEAKAEAEETKLATERKESWPEFVGGDGERD